MNAAVQTPDALVMEIGRLLLSDDRIRDADWEGLSVVVIVGEGSVQLSAYRYDAAGKPTPSTPRNFEIGDRFEELQQSMSAKEPRAWKSCLVRLKKPELKMKMDFEYDDPLRWKVTPANIASKPEELRPQ